MQCVALGTAPKHPTSALFDVRALVALPQFGGLPVLCIECTSVCLLATPDAHFAGVSSAEFSVRASERDSFVVSNLKLSVSSGAAEKPGTTETRRLTALIINSSCYAWSPTRWCCFEDEADLRLCAVYFQLVF